MIWIEILGRHREVVARYRGDGAEVRIGRGYDNDVVIDDPYVAPAPSARLPRRGREGRRRGCGQRGRPLHRRCAPASAGRRRWRSPAADRPHAASHPRREPRGRARARRRAGSARVAARDRPRRRRDRARDAFGLARRNGRAEDLPLRAGARTARRADPRLDVDVGGPQPHLRGTCAFRAASRHRARGAARVLGLRGAGRHRRVRAFVAPAGRLFVRRRVGSVRHAVLFPSARNRTHAPQAQGRHRLRAWRRGGRRASARTVRTAAVDEPPVLPARLEAPVHADRHAAGRRGVLRRRRAAEGEARPRPEGRVARRRRPGSRRRRSSRPGRRGRARARRARAPRAWSARRGTGGAIRRGRR